MSVPTTEEAAPTEPLSERRERLVDRKVNRPIVKIVPDRRRHRRVPVGVVGRFMRAELTGAGFDITPQGPASREVLPDSVTTWTWQVTARQRGTQALTLTTVVEGCPADGGACIPLRSTTQNYTVNVAVSPVGEVRDVLAGMPDWIKLVSAIVVAFAGLIGAVFSLRSALRRGRAGG